ncbi:50S ribosomal protein L10 [Fructilactobacillus lindneri]|uniref:Large ribosomal subunit protein uL10 n=2 Tax=Fructilactobacillus lindneri TaxID=53444 RepID=A0A0R2JQC7_9LACO|nr:50S ribosomal protein L10 [Fructilactobacillus lindneri]ANZ57295.1 50S ribosomal protein L10 [Fructilactobacillus lindneri]ANZ58560.1 50S ribosomal protein L10 [Fructilactobacillus lindneri]KRN79330.1 50S ribosomal protein L10 [Fructilactobacillus lindneri DSM 20690 = JCM 11027]POG98399.1 50S ribosomal protein L10 [Fructilactobacillus lindneri]POH03798.1 50S ribosomal protein L10 [Fructilactobacillus lindneri]
MPKKEVIDAKAKKVDEIANDFTEAVSAIVVNSRGLTVAQDTELRKELRENGVKLMVIKNKILERAADKSGYEDLKDIFNGPSAVAFSDEDPVAPAKILKKFADDNDALEIKGGVIEGEVAPIDKINEFATLPSREELLATLANVLQAPVRKVAYAVKAVAEKESDDGDAA